jgi:hypothetical protein
MELEIIKTQTTWNDAAASLNNNFGKVKLAIAQSEAGGGGITEESDPIFKASPAAKITDSDIDRWNAGGSGGGGIAEESDPIFKASPAAKITDSDIDRWNAGGSGGSDIVVDSEMSDTSTNPVQNKVIKEYVDLHPQYEVIEEVEVPDLPEGSGGSQGSIDLTGYATEQWVEGKGYATESWVNEQKYATEQWVSNQGFVDKAYVGSQINAYSSNTYALIAALEERIAAIEKMLEGVDGGSGCYFIPTGVTYADNAITVSYDRVGVMTEALNVKTKAKIGESIATKESTVSSSLANLVTIFTIGINGDIATMLLPSQEYTVEITVETSDSNGTTTKQGTFTFTT